MRRRPFLLIVFVVGIPGLLLADLALGSVRIPFLSIMEVLLGGTSGNEVWDGIIWNFRLPKTITAVLVGAGLGISGLLMQTLFRNPLAGPFVLGISSGANLGVALLVLGSAGGITIAAGALNSWLVVLSASLGSIAVFVLVLLISLRVRESMSLLIVGIMIASLTSALVGVLQFFSNAEDIQVFLLWTMGSLGGVTWEELRVFLPVVSVAILLALFIFKPLNGILMGDAYAASMGINMAQVRVLIIIVTSLLAGSVTAFCGPIAFIGLAVPHLTRMILESSDHKVLIPSVALMGIVVVLMCDVISQLPGLDAVVPINIVTSFVGAPVVIWIILSGRAVKSAF